MPEIHSYEVDYKGGATIRTKLIVPVLAADPSGGALTEGLVWFNSTDNLFRYYDGTIVITPGSGSLTTEDVRDAIGAALVAGNNIDITVSDPGDTITIDVEALTSADISDFAEFARDTIGTALVAGANIDITVDDTANTITIDVETLTAADISDFNAAAVAAANAGTIDADTLGGDSKATIIAAAIAGVVDTAPGTLDTLNELAAALADDPNFAATITTLIGTKVRSYAANLTGGALTEVVTHSLTTRDVAPRVYVNSGNFEDEGYIFQRTSTAAVTVVSEGQNIPAGRRIFITAVGA